MAICMFSLAGMPPLVGFYAKLAVLQALVASGQALYIGLAVFAVMMSLIGAFYYLRVVKVMYFDAPITATTVSAPADVRVVLTLNGALVLILGILPGGLMTLCAQAIVKTLAHLTRQRACRRPLPIWLVIAGRLRRRPTCRSSTQRLLGVVPLRAPQVAGAAAGRTGAAVFRRRRRRPAAGAARRPDRAAGLGVLRRDRRAVPHLRLPRLRLALPAASTDS